MRADIGEGKPVVPVPDPTGAGAGIDRSAQADGSTEPPHLTLFGRGWCHLCDDMKAALRALLAGREYVLHEVDVDTDPAIEERFGELVPALLTGGPDQDGEELCHYFLDADRVLAWLDALAASADSRGGAAISGKITG